MRTRGEPMAASIGHGRAETRATHPRGLALLVLMTGALGALGACAHQEPPILGQARETYRRAAEQTATVSGASAYVDAAKAALDRAEQSFDEGGDSEDTRDLAYIADRLAMLAEAQAAVALAAAERDDAMSELELTRAQVNEAKERQEAARVAQAQPPPAAARETEGRGEDEALARLQEIGDLRRGARGLVLSMSGSLVFTSGSARIPAAAMPRLRILAEVLRELDGRTFVVEGHTDSTGSREVNQRISRDRAEAVKRFLIQRGVAGERIETAGLASDDPVANNGSEEGRAKNRRVDVVIGPVEEAPAS